MDIFFLDTSALVKRYVTEIGSDWIYVPIFVSADTELLHIAQETGLSVENPGI